jgi:hypothetical protein
MRKIKGMGRGPAARGRPPRSYTETTKTRANALSPR